MSRARGEVTRPQLDLDDRLQVPHVRAAKGAGIRDTEVSCVIGKHRGGSGERVGHDAWWARHIPNVGRVGGRHHASRGTSKLERGRAGHQPKPRRAGTRSEGRPLALRGRDCIV